MERSTVQSCLAAPFSGSHRAQISVLAARNGRVLLRSVAPLPGKGAGKTGCRRAPAVRCAKMVRRKTAQQHTGDAEHSAFPAQWVDGLWRALPGDEFLFVTVALRIDDASRPG